MQATFVQKLWSCSTFFAAVPVKLRGLTNRQWRESLAERFVRDGVEELKCLNTPIWIHAASLGELRGVSPLVNAIQQRYPGKDIFITTTSLTGRDAAKKLSGVRAVRLLPFDHPKFVSKVVSVVRPQLLLIAETEIWPSLLFCAERENIPVVVFNGRISDKSFPNYLRAKRFLAPVLRVFNRVLVQTKLDAERYVSLGAQSDKVQVTGSTKYEQAGELLSSVERQALAEDFGISLSEPCLVVGSVRPGEDEILINSYSELRKVFPTLQLILAPRHKDCIPDVVKKLENNKIVFTRRSEKSGSDGKAVLLLDTMGELGKAYSLATVAFIGGTLVKIGGHNPLEPAAYRVPVLIGPHHQNVRDVVQQMVDCKGAFVVSNKEEIVAKALLLLSDELARERSSQAAYDVWCSQQGATARVMEVVEELMQLSLKESRHTAELR